MRLKPFQREDFARLALHDGAIAGLDTGLGKGLLAYIWPILKVGLVRDNRGRAQAPMCPAESVLLVASGDLHHQIISEGRLHFGVTPTVIDSQAKFLRLSSLDPITGRRTLAPGYYLTTYTALSRNGVEPFPELDPADPHTLMRQLHLTMAGAEQFFGERGNRYREQYELLGITPDDTEAKLTSQWFRLRKNASEFKQAELDAAYCLLKNFVPKGLRAQRLMLSDLSEGQQTGVLAQFVTFRHAQFRENVDTYRYNRGMNREIHCVYSPSLADLASDSFAVIVADEAVKVKGRDTYVGKGTRQMNAKYRLPMTATPIKNRLPDLFYLAHFATGGHHTAQPRFPYAAADQEAFANDFCVTERNLSAKERGDGRFVKRTPQVCNIHLLWKLIAPIICRRRFEDCGEEVVKQLKHVVRVPMGIHQAAAYKFHLDAKYLDKHKRPATGAKLQALRICAANPCSALLKRPESDQNKTRGKPASCHPYIPKVASALALLQQILDRREQVVVFSAFHDSLDALSSLLTEAGIRHLVMDSRISPSKRGAASAQFKQGIAGGIPVMLAGVECMSEGHSWNLCRNVIMLAYSWAWDKFLQAIKRIHRLTSEADVNVYSIICDGSIDRKLEGMLHEKRDATELVLDGHLLGEDPNEINLAELLEIAYRDFARMAMAGIDERELVKEWPSVRANLARSMQAWSRPATEDASPTTAAAAAASKIIAAPMPMDDVDPLFADLPLWQKAA
jgi:hypothetical protein